MHQRLFERQKLFHVAGNALPVPSGNRALDGGAVVLFDVRRDVAMQLAFSGEDVGQQHANLP